MLNELDPRYFYSRKLALRWIRANGGKHKKLAGKMGITPEMLSRYLSEKEPLYKPVPSRRAMMEILQVILQVCQISVMEGVPIHTELKSQLEEAFRPVVFWPLDDDGLQVMGLWTAHIVNQEIERTMKRSHESPVFLNAGGPTLLECAGRLGRGGVSHWPSISVGALNEAEWDDDRQERGAGRIAQYLSQNLRSPLLSRAGFETVSDRPGVALLSGGGECGFPCQWLRAKRIRVPSHLVGDFNYHLLLPDGNELDDQKIAKALRPFRYCGSLVELHGQLKNKTVVLALSDSRHHDPRDNPPPGSTKARLARACLAAGLANIVVLPVALAKKLLDFEGNAFHTMDEIPNGLLVPLGDRPPTPNQPMKLTEPA